MRIKSILSVKGHSVHSVRPESSVAEAVARLYEAAVGALLVCDESGRIQGIVSERDIVRALNTHGAPTLGHPVADVMTRHVATCTPEETVASAMAAMTRGRFRHLPVLDKGVVVGLVSIGDLVKHRVQEVELENGVLHDMVITTRAHSWLT